MNPIARLSKLGSAAVLAAAAAAGGTGAVAADGPSLTITNSQPFRYHMPLRVRNAGTGEAQWNAGQGRPVQRSGDDLVFTVDLPASSVRELELQPGVQCSPRADLFVEAADSGVAVSDPAGELGRLTWGLVLEAAPRTQSKDAPPAAGAPRDFAGTFAALPLAFRKTGEGLVFDTWSAEVSTAGLLLALDLDAYHEGFLDVRGRLKNESAETTRGVYAAVVCRWEQPEVSARTVCYDSRRDDFPGTSVTSFRAGEGHHLALQRGVDWILTKFEDGRQALWMNDFSESYAVRIESPKRGARWINANQPQLGQEAQTKGAALYAITEITRPVIKRYADRFSPYTLPMQGDQAEFESRMFVSDQRMSDSRADQAFVAYTCYKSQTTTGAVTEVSIGVPHVKFGTSYFPYSTLGENFGLAKLPGQDREGYWPLSADVVNNWRLFADDVRRDLRIAKSMGFEVLRLHHLEVIKGAAPEAAREFLDFFFEEMKGLGLKALLDVRMEPQEVADLVTRYRDSVDGVEIENEVLIWGIDEGREKYWNAVYDAVKAVAPDLPVNLTSHSNVGIFNKLFELGGKSDRIGFHSYVDSLDAIESARDMALAVGNYAGEVGRPAVITEWNWRFLTRLPFEERAKFYPDIVGKALETRSIAEFQQFQFVESLAMNPAQLKGIRHYEPLFLSRRPKPEAFELMKLIVKYGDPEDAFSRLDVSHEAVELDAGGRGRAKVRVKNRTNEAISVKAAAESFGGLQARLPDPAAARTTVAPQGEAVLSVALETTAAVAGFYHFFVRLETDDGRTRMGWGEARLAGAPKMDGQAPAWGVVYPRGPQAELALDWSRPTTVVYGQGAPGLEVEMAILVSQTLESATGRPVGMYELGSLPKEARDGHALILIGTPESNALIGEIGSGIPADAAAWVLRVADGDKAPRLVLGGRTEEDAQKAATDFALRTWRQAKDSATRRVGPLVEKVLPKGSDPLKLP